jgi:hypothetical protein
MKNKMTSNSNQITICAYPSRKTEKICAKNQSSKTIRKTRSFEQKGNQLYQPEEEKLLGRYAKKREIGKMCRLRS